MGILSLANEQTETKSVHNWLDCLVLHKLMQLYDTNLSVRDECILLMRHNIRLIRSWRKQTHTGAYIYLIRFISISNFRKIAKSYGYLTLIMQSTTMMSNTNSLNPDETPSNLAAHPDPSYSTLGLHVHQSWSKSEHLENSKQTGT